MLLVPLATLLIATHGIYRHMGDEVILLKGKCFVYLEEHAAAEQSVEAFWGKIDHESGKEHFMVNF